MQNTRRLVVSSVALADSPVPTPNFPATYEFKPNAEADDLGAVMFVCDAGGRISGFSVSSSRARNNEFAKLQ